MTFKLTHQQAQALKNVFDLIILPELPVNVAEDLVKDILKQIYRKLRNRLEETRTDTVKLNLNEIQCKGYYVYWQTRVLADNWRYEQNIIDAQLAALDQKLA